MGDIPNPIDSSVPAYQPSVPAHPPSGQPAAGWPVVPGYEILGELGRGGMGVVYRAIQTQFARPVALKMLAVGAATAEEERLFDAEVKAAGAVRHPHVVEVFDAGRANGRPYLAMELLPGGSLADALRDGPLPAKRAATLAMQVARGVAACHAAGVLHRDLKPGNVLLAADGTPKVTDFGLARRLDGAAGVDAATARVGTPSCMSPEQVRGGAIGPAADVYGLGAVLYALLTGRPPFPAPSPEEAIRRVLEEDPVSVRALQPSSPRDLETICHKCLAKEPGKRYATPAEVADDLERYLADRPIVARRAGLIVQGRKWVWRNRTATAVMVALAVGFGTAIWQWSRAEHARQQIGVELDRALASGKVLAEVLSAGSPHAQVEATGRIDPRYQVIKELLDKIEPKLADRYPGQPLVEATVRYRFGEVYYQYREFRRAEAQFERALALRRQAGEANDSAESLTIRSDLAEMTKQTGDTDRVISDLSGTTADLLQRLGPHEKTFAALNNLGLAHLKRAETAYLAGRPAEFERAATDAWGPLHAALVGRIRLFDRPSEAGQDQERFDALLAEYEQRAAQPGLPPVGLLPLVRNEAALRSLHNVGWWHYWRSEYGPADQLISRAVAGREAIDQTDAHPETIDFVTNLAEVCLFAGQLDRSEALYRRAVADAERTEPAAWTTAQRRVKLGRLLVRRWGVQDAEAREQLTSGYHGLAAAELAGIAPPEMVSELAKIADQIADGYAAVGQLVEAVRWWRTAADWTARVPRPQRG